MELKEVERVAVKNSLVFRSVGPEVAGVSV